MTTPAMKMLPAIRPSARLENVRYAIRDLAVLADEVARQGIKIIPLSIGDPIKFDYATPPHLVEAVERAMREGRNGYAPSSGTPEALAAIRGEAERNGISNIQDIFVTTGVSEAVEVCFNALLDNGEDILCPEPEYPLYAAVINRLGLTSNPYALDEANGWQPDFEDIERRITPRTRALVLINPNNPTGAIYSREALERIADIARRHNLLIFSDEIYDKLLFDGEHISTAAVAPDVPVVTLGGLSKNYLAPGWRIGWAVISGPEAMLQPYVEAVNKLLRARICASHPMMYAIKPALEGPQDHLCEVVTKLRSRAAVTMKWAESTPRVSCVAPRGAFYAYPKFDIPEPDEVFVKKLVRETGVLLVHGSGFGQASGTKHARIVFLANETILSNAYTQISDFMRRHYS